MVGAFLIKRTDEGGGRVLERFEKEEGKKKSRGTNGATGMILEGLRVRSARFLTSFSSNPCIMSTE